MGKSGHSAAEALLALSKPCKFGLAWQESCLMPLRTQMVSTFLAQASGPQTNKQTLILG